MNMRVKMFVYEKQISSKCHASTLCYKKQIKFNKLNKQFKFFY